MSKSWGKYVVELTVTVPSYNVVGKTEMYHDKYHDGGLCIAQWNKVSKSTFGVCES